MRRPGIIRILIWIAKITMRSRIPPLPRMYSSEYTSIDADSYRVMKRYGIRSPSGLRLAMKRHKVSTVDELAQVLEHHQAQRQWSKRFWMGLRRTIGGTVNNPHRDNIRRSVRVGNASEIVLKERMRNLSQKQKK